MTTGRPPSVPRSSRPSVTRRGGGRPAGQVGERDRDRVLEVVGETAEAGPEDDPDLGHERRELADRGLERVEPGRLVGRRDRAGRVQAPAGVGGEWQVRHVGPPGFASVG